MIIAETVPLLRFKWRVVVVISNARSAYTPDVEVKTMLVFAGVVLLDIYLATILSRHNTVLFSIRILWKTRGYLVEPLEWSALSY
jgi:hypothetical protein